MVLVFCYGEISFFIGFEAEPIPENPALEVAELL